MRYALLALVVMGLSPVLVEAGSRDHDRGRDRDSRWSVSVGFGYRDYGHRSYGHYRSGGDYFDTRITYSSGYRGYSHYPRYGSHYSPPRYHYLPTYYAPPVVYRPAPVYYPAPVYRYEPCYPTGGYSYYRAGYYYGR